MRQTAFILFFGLLALGLALWQLGQATRGLDVRPFSAGETPATLFQMPGADGPLVVIAHGFAGSERLMEPFAVSMARGGYRAVTYDALGHGANRAPMTGDVTRTDGTTARLVAELADVAAVARAETGADGPLVLIGHSMASDIVVRAAAEMPDVAAVIAISMYSTAVTETHPPNLLMIVGAGEPGLRAEALRMLRLAAGPDAEAGVTYGDPGVGIARRVAIAPMVEHASVLYSPTALREARDWLDQTFRRPTDFLTVDERGPWILLLFAGAMIVLRGVAGILPAAVRPRIGADLAGRRFWAAALVPALLVPILLIPLPEGILPVPVADYLAVHFLLYGLITLGLLWGAGAIRSWRPPRPLRLIPAAVVMTGVALGALYWPIHAHVTVFLPTPERAWLMAALAAGTIPYFLADEWLTRGAAAPRLAPLVTKLAFLASLGIAIALDPARLFFLLIILPVVLLFFLLFGLVGGWMARTTGHPAPGAVTLGILFAWALAVTFPIRG